MSILINIFKFYKEGFQKMSPNGKKLWLIIFIKLFIMFGILKVFFFKNYLNTHFETESQKIEHITNELTNIPQ